MTLPLSAGPRWLKAAVGIVAGTTLVAGIVMSWDESPDAVPGVRLHAGVAWVASNEVGQLTLLDGASAEVAAGVQVDRPGSALYAAQQGANGYALNRTQGSVVRVDGATLESSRSTPPVAQDGGQLAVYPTPDAFYTLDTQRGLLAEADPKTLKSQGKPYPLAVSASPGGAVTDSDGRLWVLDQRTGDLVWFSDGARHSRAGAATPGGGRLTMTDGQRALLDPARRTMELLDPETGMVEQSGVVELRPDDIVAVSGSPEQRRLLISVSSRGQFLSCTFGAGSCAEPVALGSGPMELGQAVEVGDRAVVPDYATGQVWIVDLARSRVIAQRRLFDHPVRFDLLTQDGVIFYNDPDSERAGVIELDGRVRPITKYQPGQSPSTDSPGTEVVAGSPDDTSPGTGTGTGGTGSDPGSTSALSIVVSPRDHGMVGDEFEFTAAADGAGLTSAQWTFGDGARANGTTVRHRWGRPGTYSVGVTARLPQGQVATAATRIVVDSPGAPPRIVQIDMEPEAPKVGQRVRFSAELTGRRPQGTAWTVTSDRGTETRSSAPRFEHAFTAPGNYTVALTVTAGAASDQRSRKFTVASEPREVRCGDTITADAVVNKDLVCTGGTGLTIAASDVDLDLGGHTISTDRPAAGDKGISIAAGRTLTNITIQNGSVSRYPTGVEMTDVADVTIANVAVSASMVDTNTPGIVGERARDVRLRNATINAYHPFTFSHDSSVVIMRSIISGNTGRGAANCAIGSSCAIERSSIHVYGLGCFDGDSEETSSSVSVAESNDVSIAYLGPYCRAATVTNSQVNLLADVSAEQAYISDNVIAGSDTLALWNSFSVTRNVFSGSTSMGILVFSGRGVVAENRFVDSYGHGMVIKADGAVGPLEISDNTFDGNGTGGAEFPGLDGLAVESAGPGSVIVVSRNHTMNNAGYGINAEPGLVTDGGGNTSSGDPKGCNGVVCLPG